MKTSTDIFCAGGCGRVVGVIPACGDAANSALNICVDCAEARRRERGMSAVRYAIIIEVLASRMALSASGAPLVKADSIAELLKLLARFSESQDALCRRRYAVEMMARLMSELDEP